MTAPQADFPGATPSEGAPRPWKVDPYIDAIYVLDANGVRVVGLSDRPVTDFGSLPPDNAALIVAAVNAYDGLRAQVAELTAERDHWKKCYYDVADAVARESTGCEDLCRQARETRQERDQLKDDVKRIAKDLDDLRAENERLRDWIMSVSNSVNIDPESAPAVLLMIADEAAGLLTAALAQ